MSRKEKRYPMLAAYAKKKKARLEKEGKSADWIASWERKFWNPGGRKEGGGKV